MPRGGRREGAGRKAGQPDKKTEWRRKLLAEVLPPEDRPPLRDGEVLDVSMLPLELIERIMRTAAPAGSDAVTQLRFMELRFAAACRALPYRHPRMAPIEPPKPKEKNIADYAAEHPAGVRRALELVKKVSGQRSAADDARAAPPVQDGPVLSPAMGPKT